jgi:NADH-quinone oxidoreductase subunit C
MSAKAASSLPATLAKAASALEKRFARKLSARIEWRGELTYVVAPENWLEVLGACQQMPEAAFDQLDCLFGDHLPERVAAPLEVVAHLVSHAHKHRLRIKTGLAEGETLPSLTALWPSAGFDERETWEMFGIEFEGHPYLERLLTTPDFEGFPLRKDFPLQGDVGGRVRTDLRGKI